MRDEEAEARPLSRSPSLLQIGTVASLGCRLDGQLASDVIGAIDFNETGELFATGGIARKIRICSYTALTAGGGFWGDKDRDGAGEEDAAEDEQARRARGRGRGRGRGQVQQLGFGAGGAGRKAVGDGGDGGACGRQEETEDEEEETEDENDQRQQRWRSSKRIRHVTTPPAPAPGFNLLDHESSAVAMMCTPAKLSSVKWVPGAGAGAQLVGCGDYDGVVTEWNVETGACVSERHEHGGWPVWSVDYSATSRFYLASAAGDGCVRLWGRAADRGSAAAVRSPRGNTVCCAQFNPAHADLLACACADGSIYLYDLRSLAAGPVITVGRHDRAASYVRFMGKDRLVSASVDSTIRLWDISANHQHEHHRRRDAGACGGLAAAGRVQHEDGDAAAADGEVPDVDGIGGGGRTPRGGGGSPPRLPTNAATTGAAAGDGDPHRRRLIRTFNAHVNARNFVGLSVLPDAGLVASGSETNDVFVYQTGAADPLWRCQFAAAPASARFGTGGGLYAQSREGSFVAAVCWKQQHDHYALVAANSDGIVQIIQARLG